MTTTTFDIDIDCPHCFDNMLDALRAAPTVTDVHASIGEGCVAITHDTDTDRLARIITDTGHRLVVAGNGEIVQGSSHVAPGGACERHR